MRAGFSESVRAPSIEEMYGDFGQEQLDLFFDADPCSAAPIFYNQIGYLGGGWLVGSPEDCVASGVPEASLYSPALDITNSSGVPVYLGGSPDLNEESAETFTAGVVWTPYDFEGFSASIDFFSIEVSDYIDSCRAALHHYIFATTRNWMPPNFRISDRLTAQV